MTPLDQRDVARELVGSTWGTEADGEAAARGAIVGGPRTTWRDVVPPQGYDLERGPRAA